MATSGQRQKQADHQYSGGTWKLKDKVKILRISCSSSGDEKIKMRARPTEKSAKQGPKKWVKKDAYLFLNEMPVIRLSPRGNDLSSSTCEIIHLDDISFIRNMSKVFKNNVLAIAFSSSNLLLAFESKCRRELWYSEIMNLTDFFTLLLYKCSHQSVKVGYYQLRFVLGYLVVYDAITKSTAWKWDISHIYGYCFEKASAIRIEVGRKSQMDGFFYFTGKNINSFCKRLQIIGHNIAKKRSASLHKFTDSASVKLDYKPCTVHTFPNNCSNDSQFNYNFSTLSCSVTPRTLVINSGTSASISQLHLQHDDALLPTSLHSKTCSPSLQCIASDKTTHDMKSMSRENFSHAVIKKSLSTGALHDYPSAYSDDYWISGTTSRNKLKLLRQHCSLDNLSTSTHDDDDEEEEEDYVIQSLYSSKTPDNDYLELLPTPTYEQIQDGHVYDEIN